MERGARPFLALPCFWALPFLFSLLKLGLWRFLGLGGRIVVLVASGARYPVLSPRRKLLSSSRGPNVPEILPKFWGALRSFAQSSRGITLPSFPEFWAASGDPAFRSPGRLASQENEDKPDAVASAPTVGRDAAFAL